MLVFVFLGWLSARELFSHQLASCETTTRQQRHAWRATRNCEETSVPKARKRQRVQKLREEESEEAKSLFWFQKRGKKPSLRPFLPQPRRLLFAHSVPRQLCVCVSSPADRPEHRRELFRDRSPRHRDFSYHKKLRKIRNRSFFCFLSSFSLLSCFCSSCDGSASRPRAARQGD